MKKFLIFLCCFLGACGQNLSVSNGGGSNPAVNYACPTGPNVMTVTVNGSQCNSNTMYINEPCASVTICQPGTTTCQTINNILVDTGSYGLRIFSSLVSLTLPKTSSGNIAECAQFGSGRTWGSVVNADVYLAGEPKANVSIQLIDNTYSGGDSTLCAGSDASPDTAQYNGILGVGLHNADCGTACTGSTPDPTYFSCTGTTCTGTTSPACTSVFGAGGYCGTNISPTTNQVSNPVANFDSGGGAGSGADSNGEVMLLAGANSGGSIADNGCMIFGVSTVTGNNTPPPGVTVYQSTNGNAEFTVKTVSPSTTNSQSFIDSGSNAIYAPSSLGFPNCSGWYCPASTTTQNITVNTIASSFFVADANTLFETNNYVFNDLSGNISTGTIDLGINYFYGRPIWIGVENKTAVINGVTYSTGAGNNTLGYWSY